MHIPKAFEQTDPQELRKLIDEYPLATLIKLSSQQGGIVADAQHTPLYWFSDPSGQRYLHGHIARANHFWEQGLPEVLCIFQGPQAYISPNWYPTKQQHGKAVPTWNYVAVHIRGTLAFIDDKHWKLAMLKTLTQKMETHIETHQEDQWKIADAPADYIDKMLEGLIGIEITIQSIEGQFKLSQNQPMVNYEGIINGLGQSQQCLASNTMEAMNAQKNQ